MRLWIAAYLCSLPLDAIRPRWSDDDPGYAVCDAEHAIALTPAARQAGARIGMRRAGMLAIAPRLTVLARQPAAEAELRQGAALALLQYTPQVAVFDDTSLLLDVGASLQLFGGPRALGRKVAGTLAALGLHAQVGMAPTARGAWLLARQPAAQAPRRVLQHATLARRLDALPLALLPEAQARQDWLQDLGCRTLGDLRRLPRTGLQRRAGRELLQALDQAHGNTPELHAWLVPPARFAHRIELPDYIEQADALCTAVRRRLLEPLCGWLAANQRAVRQLTLVIEHERGRHARPPTPMPLALSQPAWQHEQLAGLLRERLGRLELQAPAIALALHAPATVERPAASTSLFPDPGGCPEEQSRLVDLLVARLGRERVRRPAPRADHRPEVANVWQDALAPGAAPPDLPDGLERPCWLLDPPVPLAVRQHRPVYRERSLRMVRGPERIESGWWDSARISQRDYFVAQDAEGVRYWIYLERDKTATRWFLHGLYG
ncbi:Y-family DNA polymerase [Bordetella sp. 2513F-2]